MINTIFISTQIIFYFVATTAILKIGFDLSSLNRTINSKIDYETTQKKYWDNQEELANSSVLQDI